MPTTKKKKQGSAWGSLFLGFVVVFAVFLYYFSSKTKASWFDDAWRYRVAIPISAHTAAETNVYITLSGSDGINTTDTTKFQSDCGDIRFVNEAGEILPFYLTTACGLTQTGFQVFLESFPAGAQTIYYYYGNPSAPNGFSSTSMGAAATGVTLGTRGSETNAPSSPMVYMRFDEGVGQTVANSMETVNSGTLGPDATVTATDPSWRTEELCVAGKCLEFESSSSQYVNVANTIAGVKSVAFWVKPTSTTTSLLVLNGPTGNASLSVSSGTISAGAGFSSPTVYVNGRVSSTLEANKWQYVVVTTATGISASNMVVGRVNTGYLDGFVDELKLYGSALSASQIRSGYASGLAKQSSIKNSSVSLGGGEAAGILTNGLVGYWKMDESSGSILDKSGNGNTMTNNGTATFVSGKFGNGSEYVPASSQYFSLGAGGVDTYYFDASDAVTSDPNSVWTNDANAFDGSTSTAADNFVEGSASTNYLMAQGTNAPASGGSITQVRARMYAYSLWTPSQNTVDAEIRTDGWSESLGVAGNGSSVADWGSYMTLSTPTGGWTWEKVQALETRIYSSSGGGNSIDEAHVHRVELEVTTAGSTPSVSSISFWTNPDSTTNYFVSLTASAYLTSTSGTLSTTGLTNSKIYVNGVESSTIAANQWQMVTVTFDSIDASQFYIGRVGSNYYDGTLDEVRIYNRVLSSREVTQLFNWAPGPIAFWRMNENSGTSIKDESGNGLSSTLNEFPNNIWSQGKYGSSLKFDGDQAYLDIYSSSFNSLFSGSQGTISVWVKANSGLWTDSQDNVIAKIGPDTSNTITIQKTTVNNQLEYTYSAGGTAESYYHTVSSPVDWVNIAMVWDKTNDKVSYYYNGVLVSSSTTLGNWSGSLSSTRTTIGNNYNGTSGWNGSIDEVKIYNYPRSYSQIAQDFSGSVHASPVSYWRFDEGYGTTARDSISDTRNDLTMSAAGWVNNGKFGKAYDGASNRRLTRDDDADFDFVNGSDEFSLSLWFNRGGAISNQEYLLDKHATNDGFTMYMDSDGDIGCGIGDGTSFPEDTAVTTNANYDDTNWHHAVCVKKGTTSLTLYVDGRQVARDTSIAADADMSNSGKLIVGDTNETDGTDEWLGDIDEIKIYRYALTAEEVVADFANGQIAMLGASGTNSSNVPNMSNSDSYCPPGQGSTCTGPILHLKMDEGTGSTTTYDSSGNNANATMNGSMDQSDWVVGKIGESLDLDGTDDRLTSSITFPTGDFTYEAWINPSTLGASNTLFGGPQATSGGHELQIDTDTDGDIDVVLNTALVVNGTNGLISANRWSHVAVTKSGTTVSLYINGVLDITGTDSNTLGFASCPLSIGASQSSTSCGASIGNFFQGKMDDVRVYNYARTAEQVAWDYSNGAPVGHFKMDECQGATLYDSINSANSAAITIGASGTQTAVGTCVVSATTARYTGRDGKTNSAINFDGTDDYAVRTGTALPTRDFTYTAWVSRAATNNSHTILKVSPGDGTNELKIAVMADDGANPNSLRFATNGNSTYSATQLSQTNTWYHVALVRSGSTKRMYINGILDSVSGTDATALSFGSCNMYIGSSPGSGCAATFTEGFNGKIDDLRIYNYALNATQIKNVMNDGAVKLAPVTGSPN